MKNKLLNKRFPKILVIMCLLLTMVLGSSMSSFAVVPSECSVTFAGDSGPYGLNFKNLSSDSDIYSFYAFWNGNSWIGIFSASDISGQYSYTFSPDNYYKISTYKYSNVYWSAYRVNTSTFRSSDVDYVVKLNGTYSDVNNASLDILSSLAYAIGVGDSLPDGATIEEGSSIPSNPEYDSAATALIAPPSGVTYYEYVDTSQTSLTSPTVRKGQLQWNVPDDDSLYIEIYADLTYKEGLFNKKTQVVYPWKTLTNSGLKAETHKLLFDRFQAGTDYFAENGLDESAFSSHVVNGYYLRFCKINEDKSVSYSLWNKISIYRDNSLTQIGTASSETGIFDENGNWVNKQIVNSEIVDGGGKLPAFSPGLDDDGNNLPSNNNGLDLDSLLTDSNIFERFIGYLKSAISSLGELPQYVGQLFSFLPQEIIGLLGFGVIIAIILRIIGR